MKVCQAYKDNPESIPTKPDLGWKDTLVSGFPDGYIKSDSIGNYTYTIDSNKNGFANKFGRVVRESNSRMGGWELSEKTFDNIGSFRIGFKYRSSEDSVRIAFKYDGAATSRTFTVIPYSEIATEFTSDLISVPDQSTIYDIELSLPFGGNLNGFLEISEVYIITDSENDLIPLPNLGYIIPRDKKVLRINTREGDIIEKQSLHISELYKNLILGLSPKSIKDGAVNISNRTISFIKDGIVFGPGNINEPNTAITEGTLTTRQKIELNKSEYKIKYKVKFNDLTSIHTICSFEDGINNEFLIQHISGGRLNIKYKTVSGQVDLTLTQMEEEGKWVDYGIFIGSGSLKIYRKNKLIHVESSVLPSFTSNYLCLRGRQGGAIDILNGALSEFMLYGSGDISTNGIETHILNQTYLDGSITYYINSCGPDIPVVGQDEGEDILDLQVLNNVKLSKDNTVYWGDTLDPWFYYDTANPYHTKLKDFHFRYIRAQMNSLNNFIFAKIVYLDGAIDSIPEVMIYRDEKVGAILNKLKRYILFTNNNEFYKNETMTFLDDSMILEDGMFLGDV